MVPPAPGRLSIITVCPSDCETRSKIMRATMSVTPAAANGTTTRIFLLGNSCATAPCAMHSIAAVVAALFHHPIILRRITFLLYIPEYGFPLKAGEYCSGAFERRLLSNACTLAARRSPASPVRNTSTHRGKLVPLALSSRAPSRQSAPHL